MNDAAVSNEVVHAPGFSETLKVLWRRAKKTTVAHDAPGAQPAVREFTETDRHIERFLNQIDGPVGHFKLDFNIRIEPKGAGVLLTPVYKLFEYKGDGSLKNPNWHPKGF